MQQSYRRNFSRWRAPYGARVGGWSLRTGRGRWFMGFWDLHACSSAVRSFSERARPDGKKVLFGESGIGNLGGPALLRATGACECAREADSSLGTTILKVQAIAPSRLSPRIRTSPESSRSCEPVLLTRPERWRPSLAGGSSTVRSRPLRPVPSTWRSTRTTLPLRRCGPAREGWEAGVAAPPCGWW